MSEQVFLDGKVTLKGGDCLEVLKTLPDCSISSCVTDPPYHLTSIVKRFGGANAAPAKHGTDGAYARASKGFMNRTWDGGDIAFRVELWAEIWRVLKPGGWVAAFSATRTYHRMAVAIEDAGFEIRDDILNMLATDSVVARFIDSLNPAQAEAFFKLMEESQFGGMAGWAYGSGFPKSHDVSKGIDKAAGAERETVAKERNFGKSKLADGKTAFGDYAGEWDVTTPATETARQWQGFGTALKPSWEPICLARKPLIGTVAANVLAHGTGALNIDGCRVGTEGGTAKGRSADKSQTDSVGGYLNAKAGAPIDAGRWPANIVHDGSEEVLAAFPDTASGGAPTEGDRNGLTHGAFATRSLTNHGVNSGSAARFFYTAKADKLDRMASKHPTVKPVDLMQWLVRLITPPGGVVLDPFAGSGSTGEAAWREGMQCILIEREAEYQADIATRLELANAGPATRRSKAIKQVASAGPLFGDNDNEPTGGGRQIYGKFADQEPGYRTGGGQS